MKANIFFSALSLSAALLLAGCDKDTEGVTGITYYPSLSLDGDETVYVDKGASYDEPGFYAELNGEDVSDQVSVVSDVDTEVSGVYSVSYSLVNADGFASSVTRKVVVTDPNDPVEGIYSVTPDSYRIYNGATVAYGSSYDILVLNQGDYYYFSDILGGWYDQRAGYGSAYALECYASLEEDNSFSYIDSYLEGWGDSADSFTASFDPASMSISFETHYASVIAFYVTMTKKSN